MNKTPLRFPSDAQLKALRLLRETTTGTRKIAEIDAFIEQRIAKLAGLDPAKTVANDDSDLVGRIKRVLLARRTENEDIGIATKDNIFDSKVLGLFGEELCKRNFRAVRAERVNQGGWDLTAPDGKRIQVKTRAVYRHNGDGIHVDFKRLDFDLLFLVVVSESVEVLGEGLIAIDALKPFLCKEKGGKWRLRDVRTRYQEYLDGGRKTKAAS